MRDNAPIHSEQPQLEVRSRGGLPADLLQLHRLRLHRERHGSHERDHLAQRKCPNIQLQVFELQIGGYAHRLEAVQPSLHLELRDLQLRPGGYLFIGRQL